MGHLNEIQFPGPPTLTHASPSVASFKITIDKL
ncbi:hypothetical protein CCACVL1_04690 [Corchorus capsularis]|uniref:Uncharacterized protein n=1 Tax=Corchorus capsularis TaxID=210143 RepID=A0A1R3JQP7_COCAP|nr:hypothetical protein CCACVL1_04690 [Corchorus capsularis]